MTSPSGDAAQQPAVAHRDHEQRAVRQPAEARGRPPTCQDLARPGRRGRPRGRVRGRSPRPTSALVPARRSRRRIPRREASSACAPAARYTTMRNLENQSVGYRSYWTSAGASRGRARPPAARVGPRAGGSSPSTTRDTYVCRPHPPGEIAAALVGHRFAARAPARQVPVARDRRRRRRSACTSGMAGRIVVDEPQAPRGWDRFTLEFDDGGRLALRDKRRLGPGAARARTSRHVGPDAAEVGRGDVPRARRPRPRADQGAAARPGRDRRRRQPAGRRERCGGRGSRPRRPGGRAVDRGARPPAPRRCAPRPATRSATAASTRARSSPHRGRGGRCPRCGTTLERARRSAGGRRTGARTCQG